MSKKKCEIGKCENDYAYHHYNIFRIKGLHIRYCKECGVMIGCP